MGTTRPDQIPPPMLLPEADVPDPHTFDRLTGRVDSLDRRVGALEESSGTTVSRITSLESRMASMDAHLEHILDEAKRTNQILEEERTDRRAREAEEREARSDRRRWVERAAAELWALVRQPLGLLVAAALAYAGWRYFALPSTPTPVPVEVVTPTTPAVTP